jgi:hypothetical protein
VVLRLNATYNADRFIFSDKSMATPLAYNESCGAERRRNADGLRRTDGIANVRWVPLERLKSHIRTAYKGGYDVYRTQFNLTECSTVHKAQGDRVI